MSFLRTFGIYGWDSVEDILIASIVAEINLLIMGEKGGAKTFTFRQVVRALQIAEGPAFIGRKLNGYASDESDFIGYVFPPTQAQLDEARAKDADDPTSRVYMGHVFSPNTIAFAKAILINEVTRIPRQLQSRYLGILEEKEVEGYPLIVEWVWGDANPLNYQGTGRLDEALADRWHMTVLPPRASDMEFDDSVKVALTRVRQERNDEIKESDAVAFKEFVDRARVHFAGLRGNDEFLTGLGSYAASMMRTLNEKSVDEFKRTKKYPFALLDGRRVAVIANNIAGVYAVTRARRSRKKVDAIALDVFKMSLMHALTGEPEIPESIIASVHGQHKGYLKDAVENAKIAQVEKESDPVKRVAIGMTVGLEPAELAEYTRAAHTHLTNTGGRVAAACFSWVFLGALQRSKVAHPINRNAFDFINADLEAVLGRSRAHSEIDLSTSMSDRGRQAHTVSFLNAVFSAKKPVERAALAIGTAFPPDLSSAGASTSISAAQLYASHLQGVKARLRVITKVFAPVVEASIIF